jgi:hypothetical protein
MQRDRASLDSAVLAHDAVRCLVCLVLVLVPACRGQASNIDPPPPALADDVSQLPRLPPSTLNVPVEFDLTPVIEDLEDAVPRRWGDLRQRMAVPANPRLRVAFELEREPFRPRLLGDTAELTAIIHYRARAWYNPPVAPEVSASCGTDEDAPRPRARVTLTSRVDLTPEWTLHTQTRVKRVLPVSASVRDQCRVTAFRFDVTERLMQAARENIGANAPAIDRALANLDLRSRFQEWWDVLQSPIELTDSVWLVVDPQSVRKGRAGGRDRHLIANVGLTAAPRIVVGPRPNTPRKPLPPLDSGAVGDGLHILAEATIDYGVASDFLTRAMRGREIQVAGETLRILGLRAFGAGENRLALELLFDGSARGHVFFVGTPRLDASLRMVEVPDLEFDVGSAGLLVRGVAWIAHGQVLSFLRAQARLPIDEALARARQYLHDGLNYRIAADARLRGEVETVRPVGVHPMRRALVLRAYATAHAHLEIRRDSSVAPAGGEAPGQTPAGQAPPAQLPGSAGQGRLRAKTSTGPQVESSNRSTERPHSRSTRATSSASPIPERSTSASNSGVRST